ncbi:hypothetical protein [Pseudomonas gingeri]|uniref:Uncharacterized protein n=1 Tax=Pseudomonas gingeri TaxID=117681 RepID=A0A7Y7YAE9_9PSED|nr:hypothetical protein [Pseudomonas gingeri]NWB26725.1 hypothetical protein [Pseudomonas gingeri]NWC32725.1 hypothetical protein [Pseudomonas gingeri]
MTLSIMRDSQAIAISEVQHAKIGAGECLTFSSTAGVVSRVQVVFSPQDRAGSPVCVKGYRQTRDDAAVVPADHESAPQPGGETLSFYWSNSGRVAVTLYVRVAGQTETVSLVYWIHEPDVRMRAIIGSTTLSVSSVGGRANDRDEDTLQFELGNGIGKPGIAFKARVNFGGAAVAFDGEIKMLQTFEANRRKNNAATGESEIYEYDKPALDQALCYRHTCGGTDYGEQPAVAGQINLETEDSPGSKLGRRGQFHAGGITREPYFTTASADELYSMFLMYRPKGGIWVAIGQINWRWAGKVEITVVPVDQAVNDTLSVMTGNQGKNGRLRWTLTDLGSSCTNRSTVQSRLPVWEKPDNAIEQDFDGDDSGSDEDASSSSSGE